ncbi:unnamed protein product [Phytomonas sp. EM1]|nr:unnamed protein product [Phytomonas sp. EM1]|eukprot:CCW62215.1 unnamed protein product [Phytomonas sp. isolate EM1]
MLRFAGRRLLTVSAAVNSTPSNDVVHAQESILDTLSPRKITEILDKYIVGQVSGKKAVAISLRNRWRRRQLKDEDLRKEILPKNMLLIGPTGVGKTEISRRMARITDAPFVKVEATKYTEVGFKGKDVESIIEELYTNAKVKAKKALEKEREEEALNMALDAVYSSWIIKQRASASDSFPQTEGTINVDEKEDIDGEEASRLSKRKSSSRRKANHDDGKGDQVKGKNKDEDVDGSKDELLRSETADNGTPSLVTSKVTLEYFKEHYKDIFKDDSVTVEIAAPQANQKNLMSGGVDLQSVGILLGIGSAAPRKIMVNKTVSEAVSLMMQEALGKLIDENTVNTLARSLAEEEGIVFIDEIDKVVADPSIKGDNGDVSSTGVQQDLLPLVEGSNVTMKDSSVISTDNILFICSGAFHATKPSDMIAELQGRLPVRVELTPLTEEDFRCILTEPKFNLLRQQKELLKTENIEVVFTEDGIHELARVTCAVNRQGQNIGARRLNTILERTMDTYSFNCEDYAGKVVIVDAKVVRDATEKLQKNVNLAKYLL